VRIQAAARAKVYFAWTLGKRLSMAGPTGDELETPGKWHSAAHYKTTTIPDNNKPLAWRASALEHAAACNLEIRKYLCFFFGHFYLFLRTDV
jgi:hypothetical protein